MRCLLLAVFLLASPVYAGEVSEDDLTQHIDELQKQYDSLKAQLYAVQGAINADKYWLEKMKETGEEDEKVDGNTGSGLE